MINPKEITAVLITKKSEYPLEILDFVKPRFGQTIVITNCPNISIRYKAMQDAKFEHIYVQDDDCIAPIDELLKEYDGKQITCAMKQKHSDYYKESKICLVGWGALFPKSLIGNIKKYTDRFGDLDMLYLRETDRIFTYLNFPQKRLILPINDLTGFDADDRMFKHKEHYNYLERVTQKLNTL